MSIAAVSHKFVYGLKGDVANNIAFIDETTVIYPAGANTVLYNTESKAQKFIPASESSEAVTAMDLTNSKRYAAIAERGGEKPVICIYDLSSMRKRKSLVPSDPECKEFVYVQFSSDGKYVLGQAGDPDWTLYYWSWERTKLMASIKTATNATLSNATGQLPASANFGTSVAQVTFNPNDNTHVCVVGNGIIKMFRYQEGAFKPLPVQKVEQRVYCSV